MSLAHGAEEVEVDQLVNRLQNAGFNVNRESILAVLNDSPFVSSVAGGRITLGNEQESAELVGVDSEDSVEQMAANAVGS